MEFVEGDLGLWQALGGAGDERRAHVDAHLGNRLGVPAMRRQVRGEGGDRRGILAFGGEQHAAAVEIDEQADVVVATAGGGLVEGDARDVGIISSAASLVEV